MYALYATSCHKKDTWNFPFSFWNQLYVQYESPLTPGLKVMAKVKKVFQKYVKLQCQGHKVKNYGTM